MVDINKNTRCLTINVSSGSNKQNSTQADCDAISYYSELSRQWAVKLDGTVDGTENSAKYYAQLANSLAIDAEEAKDSILDDTGFIAISADLTGANNIGTCADNISCIQDAASNAQIAEAKAIIAAEQAALAQESATEVNNVLANSANTDFSNITDNAKLISSFAIMVAAIFRIAPALNRIQASIIVINNSRGFVKRINSEYEECNLAEFKKYETDSFEKLNFMDKIILKNINFSYNENKKVLKNLSLEIKKGDFIGIIGLSGAGKSTLADVIMGLLPPDSGEIIVDNTKLNKKNYQKFRRMIGYVPQQVNVIDKSFKENVAWGCSEINEEGVIKALKAAQIYDVIEEYPQGINSNAIIGSNALSQGQKQRLAIARALVKMNAEDKAALRAEGFMTRDPRSVERKKPGQPKARRRFQFSKR